MFNNLIELKGEGVEAVKVLVKQLGFKSVENTALGLELTDEKGVTYLIKFEDGKIKDVLMLGNVEKAIQLLKNRKKEAK